MRSSRKILESPRFPLRPPASPRNRQSQEVSQKLSHQTNLTYSRFLEEDWALLVYYDRFPEFQHRIRLGLVGTPDAELAQILSKLREIVDKVRLIV